MLRYCCLVLLLPSAAWAQSGLTEPTAAPAVTKARVGRKVYLKYYAVPVVTVPDAGVTARMARYFSLRNLAGNTEAGLAADLRRHPDPWSGVPELLQLRYTVNYNDRGLLSITSVRESENLQMLGTRQTYNLDLNTGFRLRMADELQPERLPELLALGEQKLRLIIQTYLADWPENKPRPVEEPGLLRLHFTPAALGEYRLTARGLLFDAANDESWQTAAAPKDSARVGEFYVDPLPSMRGKLNVTFTYDELAPCLKPASPLRRLLSSAAPSADPAAR